EVVGSTEGDPKVDLLGPERNVVMHLKTTVEPLGDKRVRKAIAYAIERGDYEAFFGRVFKASFTPIPPSYFGVLSQDEIPPELFYEQNLDQARELLAEAGLADGFSLETVVSEREDYLALAQIGQEQLAQIGIDLQLNVLDHSSWVAAIIKEGRGSIIWSSAARYPSARSHPREMWLCDANVTKPTGVQGFAEYCNEEFDALYKRASEAFDPQEQIALYKEAQLILLDELPSVPLGAMSTPVLRQGYVDLGYPVGKTILSLPYMYHFTDKTNV
ncbi:MAG: ABC transporter substrate-binding protein, partial [Pseudomonadota bacterium]